MERFKKKFKDIWLKAAVLGSLWGSIEIIFGSFFHNIKVPLAGTMLAIIGISILAAFGQSWKDKGIFWRAALISAVIKSISPSAILIGPMTGIFLEGLLFELSVRIFGRNLIGYIFGGILALYSVVFHKIITLLIIYGFDLVRITENFYLFITKQINLEGISFVSAFFLLSLFYVLLGVIASLLGIYIGRKAKNNDLKHSREKKINLTRVNDLINTENHKSSTLLLFLHLIFIIGILALTNLLSVEIAIGLSLIYSALTILKYKRALRYFKRPGFWIQILIFVFISAVFYNGFNHKEYFTEDGLYAGLKMGVRAIMVVIGFSAISSELRNPFIKAFLYKKGFRQFYTALGLAFSVLPYLMKHSAHPKKILKHPIQSLVKNITEAEFILEEFKKQKNNLEVIVIKGKKQGGKTTYVKKLINLLNEQGVKVSGFLAEGSFKNNIRNEFSIKNILTGESHKLCSIVENKFQQKIGKFYFNENGLEFGKSILKPLNTVNTDFVIIDEIGHLELKGKAWSESIELLSEYEKPIMIWVIREHLVYDILRRFGVTGALIIDIETDDIYKSTEEIKLLL